MEESNSPMRLPFLILAFALTTAALGRAQRGFEVSTDGGLKGTIPRDFYLEGSAIPVEDRNAVLIETPSGARVLLALVAASGWASRLPHKYSGMLISEGPLSVCGNPLTVGSYAFGLHQSAVPSGSDAEFVLFNQAGREISECVAKKDLRLREPRPIQAIVETSHSARLYLGRYWVELRQ
jgi:hypothetical protein